MKQFKYNKKQTATINAHNAKIDAELQRIADTISGDIMRDER